MEYKCCKMYDPKAVDILSGLRISEVMHVDGKQLSAYGNEENATLSSLKALTVSDSLTCSHCGVSFTDLGEQRNHYKLDWHKYNLKRKLHGLQPVTEENFVVLEGDTSSISGSDADLFPDESNEDDSAEDSVGHASKSNHCIRITRHAKVFFENDQNQILSVYKCLLQSKKETPKSNELISSATNLISNPKKWMIIMLGGGHFAAAIFHNENMTHHKTFHCYTIRAKQGGSQCSKDNRGGSHPKSAGASLRRFNEQALVQHVQEIMSAWSDQIEKCNLILYRAPGPWNRGTLFGGKKAPLCKGDKRLRNICFPTRRATLKEIRRVHDILTNIELYGSADDFKNEFPKSPDQRIKSHSDVRAKGVKIEKKKGSKKGVDRDETVDEFNGKPDAALESDSDSDVVRLFWNDSVIDFQQLREFEAIVGTNRMSNELEGVESQKRERKSRGRKTKKTNQKDAMFFKIQKKLIAICETHNEIRLEETLNVYNDLPDHCSSDRFDKDDFIRCLNAPIDGETGNTLLHLSASECLPEFVTKLLFAGADPAVRNVNKQTPFLVAGDKKTRHSFRQFVASFPFKYDRKKANIPAPLTEEEVKRRQQKKRERKKLKQMKEKVNKERDEEKKQEIMEREKFLALSDREKCALAAERRLLASLTANAHSAKLPVLSRCFQCAVDITGKVPFEYGNNRFCSIACLKAHRTKTKSSGLVI